MAFIPYAGVRKTPKEYEEQVQKALKSLDVEIRSVHRGNAVEEVKKNRFCNYRIQSLFVKVFSNILYLMLD